MLSLTDDSVIRIVYQIQSEVARCRLIKTHFSTLVYILGAELDSRSSSRSQWMIKQRDWGNSCGGELWHFYTITSTTTTPPSPTHRHLECCCISIEEEGEEGDKSYQRRAQEGRRRCDMTLAIREDKPTPSETEKLPAAGLHLNWTN